MFWGRWPSFYDAEIFEVQLDRGHVEPEKSLNEFPTLTLKIHLWEMTKEVDQNGYFVLRSHTLATLRFADVDNLNLVGFNHQNAIMEMEIVRRERADDPLHYFAVEILPAFGIAKSLILNRAFCRARMQTKNHSFMNFRASKPRGQTPRTILNSKGPANSLLICG